MVPSSVIFTFTPETNPLKSWARAYEQEQPETLKLGLIFHFNFQYDKQGFSARLESDFMTLDN